MSLPKDPIMLLSVVNTKLRDFYPSLEELAKAENVTVEEIENKLNGINYTYDLTEEDYAFGVDKAQPELLTKVNAFIKKIKENGQERLPPHQPAQQQRDPSHSDRWQGTHQQLFRRAGCSSV